MHANPRYRLRLIFSRLWSSVDLMARCLLCIGGGTGLSSLLRGLKAYTLSDAPGLELTAIVTVSDDGGSSGRLIEEFGVLAPGDIRNCLVALSDQSETLRRLLEYRFAGNGPLAGHNVGNLLLVALTQLNEGNFAKAIEETAQVLAVRGRILPATLEPTMLCAELLSGDVVVGESAVAERFNRQPIRRVFLCRRDEAREAKPAPFSCPAYEEAVQAINAADAIIVGPGSLYTSLLPNLIVPEIAEAVRWSKATRIFVANLMNEPGETDGYSLGDHLDTIRRHTNVTFDVAVVNRQPASPALLQQYLREELQTQFTRIYHQVEVAMGQLDQPDTAGPALPDIVSNIQQLTREAADLSQASRVQLFHQADDDRLEDVRVIEENLLTEAEIVDRGIRKRVLRHSSEKLAAILVECVAAAAPDDSDG